MQKNNIIEILKCKIKQEIYFQYILQLLYQMKKKLKYESNISLFNFILE